VRGRHWREEEKKLYELVVQCKQHFPNSARVTLVWGKGIESLSGVPTSQDQKLSYRARPPFTAKFTCQRENPNADCIPFLPMTLQFSAPISLEYANKIVLTGPQNTPTAQLQGEGSKERLVNSITFAVHSLRHRLYHYRARWNEGRCGGANHDRFPSRSGPLNTRHLPNSRAVSDH
jgi:hypothetical protein